MEKESIQLNIKDSIQPCKGRVDGDRV